MGALKPPRIIQIQDRKLGDEWIEWKGNLKEFEKNANTGKRIFLSVLLATILLTGLFGFFLWYMIVPRLSQFSASLPAIIGFFFLFFWGILALWFFIMVLSILMEKDLFFRFGGREFSITFLVPIVLKFGLQLGISRDRMGNSFVKVSNTLIRTTAKTVKPENLLILLPRCLQKPLLTTITEFSNRWKIPVHTVSGGEKAREIVYKLKPKAIIGVACERDLLSGIQEILHKIPVIGIPNRRPEGPCKNTIIDIREFERAVQTFLGSDVHVALRQGAT
jgi:hypothetical protein